MNFILPVHKGINNVDDDKRIQQYEMTEDTVILSGDMNICRNVHINKDGIISVRNGMINIYTGSGLRNMFVNEAGDICLFTEGDKLKLLNSDYTATILYSGLTLNADMGFVEHNNIIYMGNGNQMLKYDKTSVTEWQNTTQWNSEFDDLQRVFQGLPLSNIMQELYARVYVASDRYVLYSEEGYPVHFQKHHRLVVWEDVTAISKDTNALYVHTLNYTFPFIGRDPSDFVQLDPIPIGAIPHFPNVPKVMKGQAPIWLSKRGWATAVNGNVQYVNDDKFRLNLEDTAKAYIIYNQTTREVIASIWQ